MTRGPKPKPTALRRLAGNPGKRAWNHDEPVPPDALPSCPEHLNPAAREEWERLAEVLFRMGVVTLVDRAALAAYCQCYGRWVEAEEKLKATPVLLKTATGYVQQSPWLSIANKQLELMGRYMAELGLTPASRSRIAVPSEPDPSQEPPPITRIELVIGRKDDQGQWRQTPLIGDGPDVLQASDREGAAPITIDHRP